MGEVWVDWGCQMIDNYLHFKSLLRYEPKAFPNKIASELLLLLNKMCNFFHQNFEIVHWSNHFKCDPANQGWGEVDQFSILSFVGGVLYTYIPIGSFNMMSYQNHYWGIVFSQIPWRKERGITASSSDTFQIVNAWHNILKRCSDDQFTL